jgi:hypothetical protein
MYDVMIILVTSFLWIKLNVNLSKFLTVQKHDVRQFSSVGFEGLLKPTSFEGTHYKRWRQKTILWLTSMRCFYVVQERLLVCEPLMSSVHLNMMTHLQGRLAEHYWGFPH